MPIHVTCTCGQHYAVKERHAGKTATCRACGASVRLPSSTTASNTPPPLPARSAHVTTQHKESHNFPQKPRLPSNTSANSGSAGGHNGLTTTSPDGNSKEYRSAGEPALPTNTKAAAIHRAGPLQRQIYMYAGLLLIIIGVLFLLKDSGNDSGKALEQATRRLDQTLRNIKQDQERDNERKSRVILDAEYQRAKRELGN